MITDSTENLFSRTKTRRQYVLKRLSVVAFSTVLFSAFFLSGTFDSIEKKILDFWMSLPVASQSSTLPPLILSISQKSLDQIGSWPWPNRYHARMFEVLKQRDVKAIYLDDALSQPTSEKDDILLAAEMERLTIPVYFAADLELKNDFFGQGLGILEKNREESKGWRKPISILESKAAGIGHRTLEPERDGFFRFWKPEIEFKGESFKAAPLKIFLDQTSDQHPAHDDHSKELIAWNRNALEQVIHIEYADLLNSVLAEQNGMASTIPREIFKDRVCLIGVTANKQTRLGLTPWKQTIAPLEVTAMIYQSLMAGYQVKLISRWIAGGVFCFFAALCFLMAGFWRGKIFWTGAGILTFLACAILPVAFFLLHIWLAGGITIFFLAATFISILIFDAVVGSQERSNLFHLATRDGLTNLYVIRHFRVIMNQVTREACTRKEPLTVILMDIDHFKKINDTYGHPAGDMVLKKTAETIQSAVRQKRSLKDVDFVARYGGEEFIVLVRRNSLENTASRIAERIRMLIQKTHFEWQGHPIQVTVSLGVAMLGEKENVPDPMVHRADKALYRAKQSGRNRVCTEKEIG